MGEEQPSLQIDTDWKRQAQEEKRRLAEKEQEERAPLPTVPPGASSTPLGAEPASGAGARRGPRDLPVASFGSLIEQMLTQTLLYLGELSPQGIEPTVNLDRAKYQLDLLGMLEQKTQNNLDADEKRVLDSALYEARMRFVTVASQYL